MTNKEFYGDKLLAIALKTSCRRLRNVICNESCVERKKCEDCEFYNVESIENWLNAEHVEPEPSLLENGDNLKPGDWIMVRDHGGCWGKRQFLFYYNGRFYCELVDNPIGRGEYISWNQARLPMEDE